MNELPSAEFRKVYSKLKEPTLVTVNGHVIGKWTPNDGSFIPYREARYLGTQAQRDKLLNKINRGK